MGYARLRPELGIDWTNGDLELRDLEGKYSFWTPDNEWVKAVCFDAQETGLYVLTEDDDCYFTCHSVYLEYRDELPKETKMFATTNPPETPHRGKHAGNYDLRYDLAESRDTLYMQLGQDLDTWQLIARDLARDITRDNWMTEDARGFAYDVLNRLSHMPEMNIHPSELGVTK